MCVAKDVARIGEETSEDGCHAGLAVGMNRGRGGTFFSLAFT